ncbi:hypothetical protein MKZ38_000608 [Zalerion maritima]|uniref:Uncharacterized protein n=1 Tax=Zalerion maritima TaxID=339359 RepID=A0AAD5RSW0_9PEZI|nr:hypothetical protein MKZ38_000608 [Zalerion maritima]
MSTFWRPLAWARQESGGWRFPKPWSMICVLLDCWRKRELCVPTFLPPCALSIWLSHEEWTADIMYEYGCFSRGSATLPSATLPCQATETSPSVCQDAHDRRIKRQRATIRDTQDLPECRPIWSSTFLLPLQLLGPELSSAKITGRDLALWALVECRGTLGRYFDTVAGGLSPLQKIVRRTTAWKPTYQIFPYSLGSWLRRRGEEIGNEERRYRTPKTNRNGLVKLKPETACSFPVFDRAPASYNSVHLSLPTSPSSSGYLQKRSTPKP